MKGYLPTGAEPERQKRTISEAERKFALDLAREVLIDLASAAIDILAQFFQTILARQPSSADSGMLGSQDKPSLALQAFLQQSALPEFSKQPISPL